jgi:hypothetical protein
MRRREIRVAVGEPGDEHSPVFKIFNNKNDVYITERMVGHAFKVSFHESGISVIAATSKSGIELKDGNRRLQSWKRPEPVNGLSWVFGIGVPRIPECDHVAIDVVQTMKKIEWIPAAEPGHRVTISLAFVEPEHELSEYGFDDDVDYLELKNKRKVVPAVEYSALNAVDLENIK